MSKFPGGVFSRLNSLEAYDGAPATGRATEDADLLSGDFAAFVRAAWSTVDPRPFVEAWHIGAMCERLQALADNEIPNLLILVPPGTGKSLVSSVLFPAWTWTRQPWTRFLASSHSRSISVRDTMRCRTAIKHPWYRSRWSGVATVADADTKTRFSLTLGGSRVATSTGSAATGERADVLLVDDPNDLSAAYYPDQLQLAREHYNTVLRSRGTGARTKTLIIMQRVAFDDLASEVLDQAQAGGEPLDTLILPMRYDPAFQMTLPSGTTYGPDPRDERRPGGAHEGEELLFPDLYPERTVSRLEVSYSNRATAILQQAPNRSLGRMLSLDDLRTLYLDDKGGRYDLVLDDPAGAREYSSSEVPKLITVDLAVSTSSTADYTVAMVCAVTPGRDLLIVDMIRDRIEGPDIVPTLRKLWERWRPARLLVESVGFQLSVIQAAQRDGLPVEPIKRESGVHKQARALPLATMLSEGRIYVRADLPHRDALEREIDRFPGGTHDDTVDAASDAAREVLASLYYLPIIGYDDLPGDDQRSYTSGGLPFGPGENQFGEYDPLTDRDAYSPLGSFRERYGGDT